MRVVVLCGGRGTRLQSADTQRPKPLTPIRGKPLLHHLMEIYAGQGVTSFVLAGGYRIDAVHEFATTVPAEWDVTTVDTGVDTGTGERIRRCLDLTDDVFFATYGDGLGNVDLDALLAEHRDHEAGATITSVPLPSQYGTVDIDQAGYVGAFVEKPVLNDHWINAGFFVFDRETYAAHAGEDLEREVLPSLAGAHQLRAYRHTGFWKSMDTYKDQLGLEELAGKGVPPWLT